MDVFSLQTTAIGRGSMLRTELRAPNSYASTPTPKAIVFRDGSFRRRCELEDGGVPGDGIAVFGKVTGWLGLLSLLSRRTREKVAVNSREVASRTGTDCSCANHPVFNALSRWPQLTKTGCFVTVLLSLPGFF